MRNISACSSYFRFFFLKQEQTTKLLRLHTTETIRLKRVMLNWILKKRSKFFKSCEFLKRLPVTHPPPPLWPHSEMQAKPSKGLNKSVLSSVSKLYMVYQLNIKSSFLCPSFKNLPNFIQDYIIQLPARLLAYFQSRLTTSCNTKVLLLPFQYPVPTLLQPT